MKTSELNGVQLDYWVARAEGLEVETLPQCTFVVRDGVNAGYITGQESCPRYSPSTCWAQGGPIIERAVIDIDQNRARADHVMARAVVDGPRQRNGLSNRISAFGPTALVAAMRAYVASKFGDEVPDAAIGEATP